MSMKKPKVAYQVSDGEESTVLVFATSSAAARRLGAQEMDTEWEYVDSCTRVPWADEYRQHARGVPKTAFLARGWWFECEACGRRIDDDGVETDDEDPVDVRVPVELNGHLYCDPICRVNHVHEKAMIDTEAATAVHEIVEKMVRKYPEMTGYPITSHAYVTRHKSGLIREQVWVTFNFPGAGHGGLTIRINKGEREDTVASGDHAAWVAYRKTKGFEE